MSLTGLLTALCEDRGFANIRSQASRPLAERSADQVFLFAQQPALAPYPTALAREKRGELR